MSLNDGRKNGYGAVHLFGDVVESEVYNNTLIVDPSGAGSPVPVRIESGSKDAHFRNNGFYASQGLSILRIDPMQQRLVFQGNAYISADPDLELEGMAHVDRRGDPSVTEPGNRGSWPVRSFQLDGLDLRALFGLDSGKHDYYGSALPLGFAFDIGAQEWPTAQPHEKK